MSPSPAPAKSAPAPANKTRAAEAQRAKVEVAKAKAEPKAKKEPKVDPMLPKVITVATENGANPKREGTASHARFALYTKGMTVAQYLDACEKKGQSRRHARADINWDAKHGFITLAD